MKFIKAIHSDKLFLYHLRNESVSVKYSKRGAITLSDIEKDYINNPKKHVYIAKLNEKRIGYLVLENFDNNVYEISVAITAEERGKGLGKSIIKKGTAFAINKHGANKIIAKIFSQNNPSLKAFQANSYILVHKQDELFELNYTIKQAVKNTIFIFDFDGVIVDSVNSLYSAYLKFLNNFGLKGYDDEFDRLNGPKLSEIILNLKEKYDLREPSIKLLEKYKEILKIEYQRIHLCPGIEQILNELSSQDIPIVLASSCERETINESLKKHKLAHFFEYILTGEDVLHAKPSPDIYNKVKEAFPNSTYFVIEDSDNGLKSATLAGMKTIFYNPDNRKTTVNSDYEITKLIHLKPLLPELIWNCITLSKHNNIKLQIDSNNLKINQKDKDLAEVNWKEDSSKKDLFNGDILTFHSFKETDKSLVVTASKTSYKYFLASSKKRLKNTEIFPIGVQGIILDTSGNTVYGKRSNVTQYVNCYEFLPAGSIEPDQPLNHPQCCYIEQLIIELEEESGILKKNIHSIQPFCFIYDACANVYDICCKIQLNINLRQYVPPQTPEHSSIHIAPLETLKTYLNIEEWTPSSIVMMNNLT